MTEFYDLMMMRNYDGTDNYNNLGNKPQINGVTLQGNKTLSEIGTYTKAEIDEKAGVTASVVGDTLIFSR